MTGKYGGIKNVLVDFPPPVLRRLCIGDRVQITAFGQGMRLPDFPDVRVTNLFGDRRRRHPALGRASAKPSSPPVAWLWRFRRHLPLDARFGPSRRGGMITVGIVVHSDSRVAGHGPGVTPLLIASRARLRPMYSPTANIAAALGLRRRLAPAPGPAPQELRTVWRLRPVRRFGATP